MADAPKIFVDGKEVDAQSLQNLPEPVRQALVDANRNGVPDIIENIWQNPLVQKALEKAGQRNGTVYHSFDQLPAEMREPIQQFVAKIGGGTSSSAISPARPVDWKSLEQPEAPRTISIKTMIFAMAVIFALLLAGWIFFMAMR